MVHITLDKKFLHENLQASPRWVWFTGNTLNKFFTHENNLVQQQQQKFQRKKHYFVNQLYFAFCIY